MSSHATSAPSASESLAGKAQQRAPAPQTVVQMEDNSKYARKATPPVARAPSRHDETTRVKRALLILVLLAVFFFTLIEVCNRLFTVLG